MPHESAGLLLYRIGPEGVQVLLVHPGGPYWAKRSEGAWSIPKGEIGPAESPLQVALREFQEELGVPPPDNLPIPLGSVRQAGGKVVHAWGMAGDLEVAGLHSNTFEMEWPPRSGRIQTFPEVDQTGWFDPPGARRMLLPAQHPFLDRLLDAIASAAG